MKQFNTLTDFSPQEIDELLILATKLQQKPEPQALQGKVLSLLFLNPSLRTLASFQASMIRLGGGTFVISPEMSIHGLESRSGIVMDGTAAEHMREAVPVIASYGDAIGVRAFAKREDLTADLADSEFAELTALIDKPFINMESAINHPCQNLADWKTLNDLNIPGHKGKLVLSWTWHPESHSFAVPASTLTSAAMRGMDITVLRPEGYSLPEEIMKQGKKLVSENGGSIIETDDKNEAMEGAHVIYASNWGSTSNYTNHASEMKNQAQLRDWCIDESWFDKAPKDCRFMHCLPVRRGVTVEDEILDGNRSIVLRQAHNRMLVQMAVLHRMLSN